MGRYNIIVPGGGGVGGSRSGSGSYPGQSDEWQEIGAKFFRKLHIPYFGFLLYHSGHKRLRQFVRNHLSFLDEVTGSKFGILTLVEKHNQPLKIDEILKKQSIDKKINRKIQAWRDNSKPFNPDKCFEIAEALGIPRSDLPCLIIFRSSNGYRGFARMKLENSWFPDNAKDHEEEEKTKKWLSLLFDRLDNCIQENNTKKEAIREFQKELDKLSRSQNIYRPIFDNIKISLVPVFKLPFEIIASLSSIIKTFGTMKLKSLVGDNS